MVADDDARLEFETKRDPISRLPLPAYQGIAIRAHLYGHLLAIHLQLRVRAPGRNPQLHPKLSASGKFQIDADQSIRRIFRICLQLDFGAVAQFQFCRAGLIEVYDHTISISRGGESRDERHTARTTGQTTMSVQRAAVRLFSLHLDVVAPGRAIWTLRAEQLIEHYLLQ